VSTNEDDRDWQELGERLERSAEEIESAIAAVRRPRRQSSPAPVLRPVPPPERADGQPAEAPAAEGAPVEILRFVLGDESYAIEPRFVVDVLEGPPIPVPMAPHHLAGAVAANGALVPVFHLRACLGLSPTGDPGRHVLLLGSDGTPEVGVLAGGEPVWRRGSGLVAPPRWPDATAPVVAVGADGLVLLDGGALLADPRLVANPAQLAERR